MAEETVVCTICLEEVITNNDGRATARLGCSHSFHLDCIASAMNVRRRMQCPNCRHVEHGEWIYHEVVQPPPPQQPPPRRQRRRRRQQPQQPQQPPPPPPPPPLPPQQPPLPRQQEVLQMGSSYGRSQQPRNRLSANDFGRVMPPWQPLQRFQPYIAPPSPSQSARHIQAALQNMARLQTVAVQPVQQQQQLSRSEQEQRDEQLTAEIRYLLQSPDYESPN